MQRRRYSLLVIGWVIPIQLPRGWHILIWSSIYRVSYDSYSFDLLKIIANPVSSSKKREVLIFLPELLILGFPSDLRVTWKAVRDWKLLKIFRVLRVMLLRSLDIISLWSKVKRYWALIIVSLIHLVKRLSCDIFNLFSWPLWTHYVFTYLTYLGWRRISECFVTLVSLTFLLMLFSKLTWNWRGWWFYRIGVRLCGTRFFLYRFYTRLLSILSICAL